MVDDVFRNIQEFHALNLDYALHMACSTLRRAYSTMNHNSTLRSCCKLRINDFAYEEEEGLAVNWVQTKIDLGALGRILREVDTVMVTKKRQLFHYLSIDLLYLFQLCTNLDHAMSLSEAWRIFIVEVVSGFVGMFCWPMHRG